jgi:dihydroorotase-like cyclic amidohydrolase
MFDFVIRNGRLPDAAGDRLIDIGFSKDRIAAIEPNIISGAPSYDAQG